MDARLITRQNKTLIKVPLWAALWLAAVSLPRITGAVIVFILLGTEWLYDNTCYRAALHVTLDNAASAGTKHYLLLHMVGHKLLSHHSLLRTVKVFF